MSILCVGIFTLPYTAGADFCAQLRKNPHNPTIALGTEETRVRVLPQIVVFNAKKALARHLRIRIVQSSL